MTLFAQTTEYESRIIRERIMAGEGQIITIQRHIGATQENGEIRCYWTTNDDNDDGYPDGEWVTDVFTYSNAESFKRSCGVCRVGISGVVVTVSLDGKELR